MVFLDKKCCKFGRRGFRRAATLVELLVVITIMSTMASMLLPALQSGRESSRATTCRHNLKQIGITLLNFESVHEKFPKGAAGQRDPLNPLLKSVGLSWWMEVLPYLEESDISEDWDRTGTNTGWSTQSTYNAALATKFKPSFFFCPTSPVEQFAIIGDYRVALPSYTGISGATNHDGFSETRVSHCCRSDGQIAAGGVLIPNAEVRSQQITDGTTKTLVIAEQSDFAYANNGTPQIIGPSAHYGWPAGTLSMGTPPNYGSWLDASYNIATVRYRLNERRYQLPGIWFDRGANNPLLSAHPGTVNVLFCDGSVHALGDSLELNVLKSLATRDDGSSMDAQSF